MVNTCLGYCQKWKAYALSETLYFLLVILFKSREFSSNKLKNKRYSMPLLLVDLFLLNWHLLKHGTFYFHSIPTKIDKGQLIYFIQIRTLETFLFKDIYYVKA